MRVFLQWAQRSPTDWLELPDVAAVHALPDLGIPTAAQRGNAPGWVQALNIQGITFENWDHYGLADRPDGGLTVYVWNDDPEDFVEPFGQRWELLPPAPDPNLGGLINTRQTLDVYGPPEFVDHWLNVETSLGPVGRHPWSLWPTAAVAAATVRHGVWVSDNAYNTARNIRSPRRWDEWVEATP